jgi:hypothetical protein
MEDHSDINAFNYHMKEYYRHLANSYQSAARRAIEAFETLLEAEENGTADTALIHPIRDQDITMPAPKVMGRLRLKLVDGKTVREQLD